MKARLIFDLNEPDDRMAHLRCTKALQAYIALHEIVEYLRNNRESDIPDTPDALIRNVHQIIDDSGVDLMQELE